jgi:hypothetical protein
MDKYFNVDVDEMMIEYSEMTGFNFDSAEFQNIRQELSEYAKQPSAFKYGKFDMVDYLHALCQGA